MYDSDSREGETDFVMASQFVQPNSIKTMRQDGGGLIFLMTSNEVAQILQLPFLSDLFFDVKDKFPILKYIIPNDIPYDTKSSFSLYINHRKTFTGITDNDRSLTMGKFAEFIQNMKSLDSTFAQKKFGEEFRSPGHIPICVAAKNLLYERSGHTELVLALLQMASLLPAGSGCEIMGNNGTALSRQDALRYAERKELVFLEGNEIVDMWKSW